MARLTTSWGCLLYLKAKGKCWGVGNNGNLLLWVVLGGSCKDSFRFGKPPAELLF